jgi:hypothetical protein
MDVQLLVVPDCAHGDDAAALLRRGLDDIGLGAVAFETVVVSDPARAAELSFVGSPSFMVDGRDLFAEPDVAPALACRLYRTRSGPARVLDLEALRQALKKVTDRARRDPAGLR